MTIETQIKLKQVLVTKNWRSGIGIGRGSDHVLEDVISCDNGGSDISLHPDYYDVPTTTFKGDVICQVCYHLTPYNTKRCDNQCE